MSELSERRTSKFFNRALPDPPTSSQQDTGSARTSEECLSDEPSNLYELVSRSTPEHDASGIPGDSGALGNSGEMYEDIDDCLERSDPEAMFNDSSSSHRSSASRSASSIPRPTRNNLPDDDEYLEPVIPPDAEMELTSSWRPSPAPRYSLSGSVPTSYVNAEMMSTAVEPPSSVSDGLAAVTQICREALKQVADRLSAQYMTASWPASVHLDWSDFELAGGNAEPHLTQQHVSYYHAKHASLAPKGCVLMVRPLGFCSLTFNYMHNVMRCVQSVK